eukprot:903556-Rhodomonas_salina.7
MWCYQEAAAQREELKKLKSENDLLKDEVSCDAPAVRSPGLTSGVGGDAAAEAQGILLPIALRVGYAMSGTD